MGETATQVGNIVLAALGVGLVAGGGYGVAVGLESFDTCGSTELIASESARVRSPRRVGLPDRYRSETPPDRCRHPRER